MGTDNYAKYYNLTAPILICGETGTGKSRLAKMLYEKSQINKEKFLTLHLASIKEELLESELFGHKKGSFTGAVENKNGYLKEVGNGTLFLDEIGELSLEAQKKLLYVLEEKIFVPVGNTSTIAFRGRLIFATNKNLQAMVQAGSFREDLYYRLTIFQIFISPLRDNLPELRSKISHYFNLYKHSYDRPILSIAEELQIFLETYAWNGNVRELKNCIEAMVALSDELILTLVNLPDWIVTQVKSVYKEEGLTITYGEAMEKFEAQYLRNMFEKHGGKVNETARKIEISKVSLISKARKYHINTLEMRVNASKIQNEIAA
jgi:transcriptional regulator with PAS, ATPase and Fis domain